MIFVKVTKCVSGSWEEMSEKTAFLCCKCQWSFGDEDKIAQHISQVHKIWPEIFCCGWCAQISRDQRMTNLTVEAMILPQDPEVQLVAKCCKQCERDWLAMHNGTLLKRRMCFTCTSSFLKNELPLPNSSCVGTPKHTCGACNSSFETEKEYAAHFPRISQREHRCNQRARNADFSFVLQHLKN